MIVITGLSVLILFAFCIYFAGYFIFYKENKIAEEKILLSTASGTQTASKQLPKIMQQWLDKSKALTLEAA